MGLGGMPAEDDKFLGMVGMHGTYEANMAMQHCDVLMAIGARFDDRVIGNPADFSSRPRTIIQIDIDPSSISKCVHTDIPIVGDVRSALNDFVHQLEGTPLRGDPTALDAWMGQISAWRAKNCLHYKIDRQAPIKPQAVIEMFAKVGPGCLFLDGRWRTSDVVGAVSPA